MEYFGAKLKTSGVKTSSFLALHEMEEHHTNLFYTE
jgi:hypothetical protein